jgi:hypothetical protein
MVRLCFFSVFLLINLGAVIVGGDGFSRDEFPPPPGFVFGSGTSAYQVSNSFFRN